MSDEQKRIEELEQQLKIAKIEKELAELKNEISQEQKPVSKRKQKKLDKELEEKEEQETLDNIYKAFLGLDNKTTRTTILEKLENTKKRILVSEYLILNGTQQKTYKSRVNWFSLLLYPCAIAAYLVALFFQNPWRNSLIFAAMWFLFMRPSVLLLFKDDVEANKNIEVHGIPVSYSSRSIAKEKIQKYAKNCYDDNYIDKDSLNECVTNAIKGVPMKY